VSSRPPSVLLVEDDPAIGRTVAFALEREGFAVEHVLLVGEARRRLAVGTPPSLLVLDIGLPDGNGLDLCRMLRETPAHQALPILVLSARSEEIDRVLGLELGADDYLAKPFSPRELVARVRALLRRASLAAPRETLPRDFEHDAAGQRIALAGHWLALTRLEYGLLAQLLQSPGRILPREQLLARVWGAQADAGDRTVDTHVKTLRAKLREVRPGREFIVTHRGLGYSLQLPPG
jgi:two-component system, OmpR family, catabolic regulation response regulator CreB